MSNVDNVDNLENTPKSDIMDDLYNALVKGEWDNRYYLNEIVCNQAYVVIGKYAYTFTSDGQFAMFPYKLDSNPMYAHTRPHWVEGVVADETSKSDNPDIWRNVELSGFPIERLKSVVSDLMNMQDIMRQCGMNYETA